MLLMHYQVPPHHFSTPEKGEESLMCPLCQRVYPAKETIVAEAVAHTAFNDPTSIHSTLLFCGWTCVLLSLSGGSRA